MVSLIYRPSTLSNDVNTWFSEFRLSSERVHMLGKSSKWKNRKINFSGVKDRLKRKKRVSKTVLSSSLQTNRKISLFFNVLNAKNIENCRSSKPRDRVLRASKHLYKNKLPRRRKTNQKSNKDKRHLKHRKQLSSLPSLLSPSSSSLSPLTPLPSELLLSSQ